MTQDSTPRQHILVVDDDADLAGAIANALRTEHRRCVIASTGAAALDACRRCDFDVVISDICMDGMDGVELMTRLRHLDPDLPVILMTGKGSIPAAVEAVKRGAIHYLAKPCGVDALRTLVDDAVLAPRSRRSPRHPTMPWGTEELVGDSPSMTDLRRRIELVSVTQTPVLIIGETGTGKELVARALHACSARRGGPFVTVNTSAIPEALLESEMFGHARGAFTGATQAHRGLLAAADGGTLLLDEIGDMPLGLQAKLLRVLQSGESRAVGGDRVQRVDVRFLAATHQPLPQLIREGRFREDLYYRLNVITVNVPPLRARACDIPMLSQRFLERARERAPASVVASISPELLHLFGRGTWPGNVRELESVIERLVVFAPDAELTPAHLPLIDEGLTLAPESRSANETTELVEIDLLVRGHVDAVLAHTEGNKQQAAKILGIDLSTLYRWQQKRRAG